MSTLISLKNGVQRNDAVRFNKPINFSFYSNEHLAILGPNGSGKTILIETLLGKYTLREGELTYNFGGGDSQSVYKNVKYITFRDSYGEYDSNYYYQQRWNSQDLEDIPEASKLLGETKNEVLKREVFELFQLEPLLKKKIILLSSGELRKFQLAQALLSSPRVLILDNPFIGLDVSARGILLNLLEKLSKRDDLQIILIVSRKEDIPDFITHIIAVDKKNSSNKIEREAYLKECDLISKEEDLSWQQKTDRIKSLVETKKGIHSDEIVRLENVTIQYGEHIILRNLNWVIKKGEKWALSGQNGSGKSTLLSLVCADNPQSYACDIHLFGRKRGTGESIWDIKENIGYVSPEMHRAYLKNIPTIEIVGSGLHDSIGLYRTLKADQVEICKWWMNIFEIEQLKDTPFLQLSSGEQRLTLLARAFAKDPQLLILDEPLRGLDTENRILVKRVIDSFCEREDKTLIMVTHYEEELPNCIEKKIYLVRSE